MSQPSAPTLPAPINSSGKTITQRLSDVEAAVNSLLAYLPTRASNSDVQALKSTLDTDRRAAEARHQELLKAVAQSAQPPVQLPDLSGLQKQVARHDEAIAALQSMTLDIPSAPDLAPLEQSVQGLDERVLELETRPAVLHDAAQLELRVVVLEDLLGLTLTPADSSASATAANTNEAPSAPLNEVQDA